MSAEAKPVETPVSAAEPTAVVPLVEPTVPETKPLEETPVPLVPAAPATEEPKTEEAAAAAAAPVDTAKKSQEKPVEPVTDGSLTYKAPAKFPKNLVPGREHKYFFYFGDAAVPAEKLSALTSSIKADYTHDAAAWSSQTGKGLLFYSKTKDDKESPVGVLPLSEVTDIREVGLHEFTFKIGEHKHVFQSTSAQERAGWLATLKAEVEAATGKKEEIHGSDGFKKALESFKPAVIAGAVAHPKKSTDIERATRDETPTAASKDKVKSRSVSRGKGIFDRFGKKEAAKDEVKKEETPAAATTATEDAPVAAEPAPPAESAPVVAAAPLPLTEEPKPEFVAPVSATTDAAPAAAAAAAVLPLTEEPKAEEAKPVNNRRSSKFGDFFKKVTSPTTEKKEHDVVPAVAAAETTEAEKSTEAETLAPVEPVVPAVEAAETPAATTTETPAAAAATTEGVTPSKEKKKFGLPNLFEKKAKTPSTETPAAETVATETAAPEAPAAVTETEAVEASEPAAAEPPVRPTADTKEKRRSSFFGDLAGSIKKQPAKKEKAPTTTEEAPAAAEPTVAAAEPAAAPAVTEPAAVEETKPAETEPTKATETSPKKEKDDLKNKVVGLGRRFSTAIRGNKEKKAPSTPAKVDEASETKPISSEAPQLDEPAKLDSLSKVDEPSTTTASTSEAPKSIGDVVPEAVNIGSAPAATPTVSATA